MVLIQINNKGRTMLADKTLITIEDVRLVRYLSKNYEFDKFQALCLEVQRNYVLPLLSAELYTDLITGENSESNLNYRDLLDGIDWADGDRKIRMQGLKLYIVYMFLYLFMKEGGLSFTETGAGEYNFTEMKDKKNPLSVDAINNFFNSAKEIANSVTYYLEKNITDYPKYKTSYVQTSQTETMNFRILGEDYSKHTVL